LEQDICLDILNNIVEDISKKNISLYLEKYSIDNIIVFMIVGRTRDIISNYYPYTGCLLQIYINAPKIEIHGKYSIKEFSLEHPDSINEIKKYITKLLRKKIGKRKND